jgi:glycyl-tRNA synthetase
LVNQREELVNTKNAYNVLIEAGYDSATATKYASDSVIALGLATGNIDLSRLDEFVKKMTALEKLSGSESIRNFLKTIGEENTLKFFVPPAESAKWYEYWCETRMQWYIDLGIPADMLRLRAHDADELSHYSSGTSDIEFKFPWGWGELEGIAQRTNFDLNRHAEFSKQKLDYFDQATNERYVPYVVEPAAGANRTMAAFLLAAYDEDVVNDETRTVLRLHPRLAPYKVAVLPLSKKDTLTPLAREIFGTLSQKYMCEYDETQQIGRRYRRQDEIGTPLCITVDFDSLEDHSVTIRHRDTTEQVRVPIADLEAEVARLLGF